MKQLVKEFPSHIPAAIGIGDSATITGKGPVENVIVTGLGGSGIGGAIVHQLIGDQCTIPFVTNNDYGLPAFANEKTLVIVSSYSGNTEETVNALKEAIAAKSMVACITSGGKIAALAQEHNLDLITIPGGFPPRSMLAYSVIQQMYVLKAYGVINDNLREEWLKAGELLDAHQSEIETEARRLTQFFSGRIPVLYTETRLEGIAIRWRQQLNENSKVLCWHHTFPEMNHNELVGWETGDNKIAVLMLTDGMENPRNTFRMEVCEGIFSKKCDRVERIEAHGANALQKALYLIHLGDWISIFLAEDGGFDPVKIDTIIYLKSALDKQP